jgi:hypothetical protein
MQQQQGLIAILDALGAANYSGDEIAQFQKSQELVLDQLQDKAIRFLGPKDARRLTTFTFNDTVLIVYRTENPVTLRDVQGFGELLRRFDVKSLAQGILFRGAIAIGRFYVNARTNTVMGEAVTDAAAWYDRADWIGITATPQATLLIQSLTEQGHGNIERLMVDYPVPFKDRSVLSLKAVNWPKAFFVRGMTPCAAGEEPRAKCLSLLTRHGVPRGTESKYFNSVAFFDHCVKLWQIERKKKSRDAP